MEIKERIKGLSALAEKGSCGVIRGARAVEAKSSVRVPFAEGECRGEERDEVRDVYIKNGKIAEPFDGPYDFTIDGEGLVLMPGLVDIHCHLRDPGQEYKEDILSGARSAAAGGFTSVCCMPNTIPVVDNKAVAAYIKEKGKKSACKVYPIGAVTKGQGGEELAEMGQMKDAGIVAVCDDGGPVATADRMYKGMQYASDFGLVVIDHCEDPSLMDGTMNEGEISTRMGEAGIPSVAEDIIVARDILLADYLDLPVHIAHVSTKRSVSLIREAKAKGIKVTAETCPHYFSLTDKDCLSYSGLFRVNPPLRQEEDRLAIIEGLKDGTLDCLATDHAPHHKDEKEIEFSLAKNGMIGFETAFALAYTYLAEPGIISLTELVRMLSANPAAFMRIPGGSLEIGEPADLFLADVSESNRYDRSKAVSRSKNSPYDGYTLKGKVLLTLSDGRKVYEA